MLSAAIVCETRIGIPTFQNEAPPRTSIRALGSSTSRPLKLGHRSAVGDEQDDDEEEEAAAVIDAIWFLCLVAVYECIVFLQESTAREYRKLFVNNKQKSIREKLLTDVANLHM
ncbi:unnamed protein product [Sphagnum balticum]